MNVIYQKKKSNWMEFLEGFKLSRKTVSADWWTDYRQFSASTQNAETRIANTITYLRTNLDFGEFTCWVFSY